MPRADLFVLRHGRSLANEASLIVSSMENGVLPQYALAAAGKEQAAAAGRLLAATLLDDAGADADADATTTITTTTSPETVVHFYASPFSRTVETAAIAAEAFEQELQSTATEEAAAAAARVRLATPAAAAAAPPLQIERNLRERWFGAALELQSHEGYSPAWASDARDPTSRPPGEGDGESVAEVAARSAELLARLAERHGAEEAAAEAGAGTAAAAARRVVVVLVSHGDTLSILQAAATGGDLRGHRKFGLGTAELKRVGSLGEAARRAAAVVAAAVEASRGGVAQPALAALV